MSIHICSQIQPVQTVQWYLSICFQGWQFGPGQSVAVLSPREGCFSHSQLSLVVYGSMSGIEAWGLLFIQFGMSICVILFFSSYLGSSIGESLWVQLLMETHSQSKLLDLALTVFPPSSPVFHRYIHGNWAPQLFVLIGCGFCNGPHLLHKEVSLMQVRPTLISRYKDKCL